MKLEKKSDEQLLKTLNFSSIQFKTWMSFCFMAAVILIILWLVQIIFFKTYYQSMKRLELERVGDKIALEFPGTTNDERFNQYIVQTAFNGGLNVIVFRLNYRIVNNKMEDIDFVADYLSSQFNGNVLPEGDLINTTNYRIIEDWEMFFPAIVESNRFTYLTASRRGDYIVYGAHLANDSYLYISSPLAPMDSTTSVLTNQLIIVTIICLLLSLVLSWFISSRISKPIAEFSKVARKLATGDYSVKFVGNGYTEIEDLAQTLNYATEEMGKTESLRRDFLANVSHDLRTPLTMVKAYAEMIRDISGKDTAKRTEHSQVIIDEADRLTSLVNDILNLSKLQAGTESIEFKQVELAGLVREVVERFDIYRTKFGYTFIVEANDICMVSGDSMRLEQVLYNLIGNAINYTGEDKTIKIAVNCNGENLRLSVSDSGNGIAPEEIDSVWERYYRANQRKRGVVGSGLGLSIVKNILIAHNAKYGIDSVLTKGTTFWFELPQVRCQEEPPQLPTPQTKSKRKKL